MAKPILIMQLRPEDETSDNEFEAFLKYGEISSDEVKRLRIEKNGIPEDLSLDDYCGIIVGGSPFDISTPANEKTAIQKKIESDFIQLFDNIIAEDFPFLGACSGNGLLGSYLGTPISKKHGEPVGCYKLTITDAGKLDPLLSGFPEQVDVLLGHKEACDNVPAQATLLMTSASCPVQMFRVKQNIYATQFHPEGDSEGFIVRINTYKNHGYFEPHEEQQLIQAVSNKPTPHAQQVLKRFVELARQHDHS